MVNISSVAGRVARRGSGVYNLTKHGVGAFSESLRQEVAAAPRPRRRSSSRARRTPSSPRTTAPRSSTGIKDRFAGVERLQAQDIADAILYIVTRPRRAAVNEILIRPPRAERLSRPRRRDVPSR